MQPGLD
jgi:hypothetical protein